MQAINLNLLHTCFKMLHYKFPSKAVLKHKAPCIKHIPMIVFIITHSATCCDVNKFSVKYATCLESDFSVESIADLSVIVLLFFLCVSIYCSEHRHFLTMAGPIRRRRYSCIHTLNAFID